MCFGHTSALRPVQRHPNRLHLVVTAPENPNPLRDCSINPSVTPVNTPLIPVQRHLHPRRLSLRLPGDASAPSTPRSSFVLTRTAPITAGPVVVTSALTGI